MYVPFRSVNLLKPIFGPQSLLPLSPFKLQGRQHALVQGYRTVVDVTYRKVDPGDVFKAFL